MAHWSPSLLLGYIVFWSIICLCVAFPTGAPASACENMMPVHTGVQPQASPAPYEIQVDASSFVNRQPINVQVVGPGYRGLLLEARTFGSTAALGRILPITLSSYSALETRKVQLLILTPSSKQAWPLIPGCLQPLVALPLLHSWQR
ncbi:putative defense protein 1 [Gopherus flavomarginatus]|uniref:putative defense protein 1 n=1 Tax=Gopherus flavomarginatus TaxID=286002 RepID=UPI0021CC42D5|nr:putative defense protein 1 [Gopherus flavomarginatus]